MNSVYFTICSANYLPYVRVLHKSLRDSGSTDAFVCFLVDEIKNRLEVKSLGFDCVEVKDIGCQNFYDMAARYTIMEMNTAVKPFCMKWLLENRTESAVIYLDPDILIVSRFTELEALLTAGAAIVLTPHSLKPLDDGKDPDDLRMMRTGAYNLGFCAVGRSPAAFSFIDWWSKHLVENCIVDLKNGIFVDQKFCDLVPSYFDDVVILRHPGYNAAYWNLMNRPVVFDSGALTWRAGGEPLRFFHFSGVVPAADSIFSKHQNRYTRANIGDVGILLDRYLRALRAHARKGDVDLFVLEYAYGKLSDGTHYNDDMRQVYAELNKPLPQSYADAFNPDLGRFVTLAPDVAQHPDAPVTRLMQVMWKSRDDVQLAFPLNKPEGRKGLYDWFLQSAGPERRVPKAIIEATRKLRDAPPKPANNAGLGLIYAKAATGSPSQQSAHEQPNWLAARQFSAETEVGLAMFGYFRSENGLGSAARQNMRAARAAGLPVTAYNVPCLGFADNLVPEFALHTGTPKQDIVLLHVNADTAKLIRTIYDPRVFQSRHKIGYWAWELSAMPIEWVGAYDEIDEVWAPSQFSAAAFAQRTRKPVTVMSHPVEVPAPPPDIAALRRRFKIAEDRFVFLTAFDLNSYIARKNPFATVQAFSSAFVAGKSSPLLVVKMHGEYHRDARFMKLQELIAKNPNIIVIDSVLDTQSVSDLQWCCDAFVSLHRSEGFGLWIAECMARGKPCVVTGYSGNMDFTTTENSIPVGFSLVKVNRGEYPYGEGQSWAEPSADEAVAAMRALVENAALASRIGRAARETMQNKFSMELIGGMIYERLFRARAELLPLPQIRIVD